MTYRQYQEDLKAAVRNAWTEGHKDVMAVLATGGGKTKCFSDIIAEQTEPSAAIVHRAELVSQMSLALARNGVRHRVIGPDTLQRTCVALHMSDLGKNYVDPSAKAATVSVDTLVRLPGTDPWFARVKLVVTDECFPAGTRVSGFPIETIRVGDTVEAFDENDGKVKRRKVTRIYRNPAPDEMVAVRARHHLIECTKGHPFYTQRGWVEACNLNVEDQLLTQAVYAVRANDPRHERSAAIPISQSGQNILHSGLWLPKQGSESATPQTCGTRDDDLLHLRARERIDGVSVEQCEEDRSTVLQSNLLKKFRSEKLSGNDESHQSEIRCGFHDAEQQTTNTRNSKADQRKAQGKRSSAQNKGRQRQTADAGRTHALDDVGPSGICDAAVNPDTQGQMVGVSAGLQTRSRSLADEVGDRSRWAESFGPQAPGRKEGRVLEWVGVDRVEIFKRADSANSGASPFVYNIEVEGLHTYIANGVVVHNCTHLLKENKWGKARAMFPNARGLGVTATPIRSDGKGLGRHHDGLFDVMVQGPAMRDLIRWGYLTDYRAFAPPNNLDLSEVGTAASGDYSPPALKVAVGKARITGDIVEHYKRIALGKLGVTFCVSVAAAMEVTQAYREAGVAAECITGETPDSLRASILRRFRNREVLQLCSVDIFSEGFDLPAIEVVSLARPTQSFGLYCQQIGRALRPLEGKEHAIIIDHVGNIERFARTRGLPDTPQQWTLDRREKTSKGKPSDAEPMRTCLKCTGSYSIIEHGTTCPYCDNVNEPAGRSSPALVDGVLAELDPEVLRALRREADDVMGPAPMQGASLAIARSAHRNHVDKQTAQNELRMAIATLGAVLSDRDGRSPEQAQRRFLVRYGIDSLSAAALGTAEARALLEKISTDLAGRGYNTDGSVINKDKT